MSREIVSLREQKKSQMDWAKLRSVFAKVHSDIEWLVWLPGMMSYRRKSCEL
jgi:hypothetical protein